MQKQFKAAAQVCNCSFSKAANLFFIEAMVTKTDDLRVKTAKGPAKVKGLGVV